MRPAKVPWRSGVVRGYWPLAWTDSVGLATGVVSLLVGAAVTALNSSPGTITVFFCAAVSVIEGVINLAFTATAVPNMATTAVDIAGVGSSIYAFELGSQ